MIEYEGQQVFLSNPQDQIKHLRRVANEKDRQIAALKSQIEEMTVAHTAVKERLSRLLGDKSHAAERKRKQIEANRTAAMLRRHKKPGEPKKEFSPEIKAKLAENLRKAREARFGKKHSDVT